MPKKNTTIAVLLQDIAFQASFFPAQKRALSCFSKRHLYIFLSCPCNSPHRQQGSLKKQTPSLKWTVTESKANDLLQICIKNTPYSLPSCVQTRQQVNCSFYQHHFPKPVCFSSFSQVSSLLQHCPGTGGMWSWPWQ